ncbi:GNAT family N-acetyltransferase [Roseateles sp. DAIF2]|uniref:acyl-homoserine-lactone synthase n=1 Tax=Roseateles sp. DAIF2 TaxID=2714952 RepID=UPI0018A32EE9|nr:acyl-homoserine-lactone synthase [Roseateles sp. DAIF2]QPF73621.1 GNAT family N-acetyltransferase [Roseateles sp. DAIF2]
MNITAIAHAEMGQQLLAELAAYRYRVFVETLGWTLNCAPQRELDQFDHADAHYVLLRDREGRLSGCARLLPTTRPYLLSEVFPMLAPGGLPSDAAVWELSRFVTLSPDSEAQATGGNPALRQFSSDQAIALLQAAIDHASAQGVSRLVTVSPVGVERLLTMAGFSAGRLAPPQTVGGRRLFACQIECRPRQVQVQPAQAAVAA